MMFGESITLRTTLKKFLQRWCAAEVHRLVVECVRAVLAAIDLFSFLPQVLCGVCGSYSGHLYERLANDLGTEDGLSMKNEFCTAFTAACDEQIDLPVYGNLEYGEVDYCTMHTGGGDEDLFWSYPYEMSE